jgi:2-oxoglutarate dehydrogenase complex dehydrogenase (E1) component-like enzyme
MMIDRYRAVGHQFAKTDPLGMNWHYKMPGSLDIKKLNVEEFGFSKNGLKDEIMLKYLREENSDKKNGPYTIQAM